MISNISTLQELSRAAILVAVFSSDACKEGEICPEMQIVAKLTNIPIYLLSTDENNNYSENNTCMKQGKRPSAIEKISLNCNHSFREEYERRVLFRI